MKVGAIDIGTNTVLCLKAFVKENTFQIISDNRFHYRAGRRLDNKGNISEEYKSGLRLALRSAIDGLKGCSEIKIVATEVLRKPDDGAEFAEILSRETGHAIDIIDSRREAELSFLGATANAGLTEEKSLVLDVGGGSSELATGIGNRLEGWSGIKIGAVTINESAGYEKPVGEYLDIAEKAIDESDFKSLLTSEPPRAILVGGTAVALAAILLEQREFKPGEIQGFELRRDILNLILEGLSLMSLKKRKIIMSFDPQRADIIVGGGAIILAFMNKLGFETVKISTSGLRHGLLLELYG